MKYMTKEWYNTMQKTSFHLLLKTSKQAESFSEDYFKQLYKKEEAAWLQLQEDVSNVKFEDVFPEEFYMEKVDGTPIDAEEFEEAKKSYFEMREQARINYENNPTIFDAEQERKTFKQSLRYNTKHLKTNLPENILQKVADIRVLALNRASAEVKKEITAFCKENDKSGKDAMKAYWKDYNKTFKRRKPDFAENFNFHDCKIVSYRKKGSDLLIGLDNSGGFTGINQIIFKNCDIIKQDKSLRGAWWLYDEIYKTDNGYQIHVLLQNKELIDFTVNVKDVEFVSEIKAFSALQKIESEYRNVIGKTRFLGTDEFISLAIKLFKTIKIDDMSDSDDFDDMLLFQYGVYDWGDKNGLHSSFDISRQFCIPSEDEPYQINFTLIFEETLFAGLEPHSEWSDGFDCIDTFCEYIKSTPAYKLSCDKKPVKFELHFGQC